MADTPPPAEEPTMRIVAPDEVTVGVIDPVAPDAAATAKACLAEIAAGGEAAVRKFAEKFGDVEAGAPLLIDKAAMKAAFDALDPATRDALERTATRVRAFADAQRASVTDVEVPIPGGFAGHTVAPVEVRSAARRATLLIPSSSSSSSSPSASERSYAVSVRRAAKEGLRAAPRPCLVRDRRSSRRPGWRGKIESPLSRNALLKGTAAAAAAAAVASADAPFVQPRSRVATRRAGATRCRARSS
jgi:hypothetical protein